MIVEHCFVLFHVYVCFLDPFCCYFDNLVKEVHGIVTALENLKVKV